MLFSSCVTATYILVVNQCASEKEQAQQSQAHLKHTSEDKKRRPTEISIIIHLRPGTEHLVTKQYSIEFVKVLIQYTMLLLTTSVQACKTQNHSFCRLAGKYKQEAFFVFTRNGCQIWSTNPRNQNLIHLICSALSLF